MTSSDERLLGIGQLSRASGLTVSALRFYDREGVLVPAEVDGQTGYRRYAPDQVRTARMLAGMRRIQVPVAEMVAVLEADGDADTAADLLAGHLQRLERGLADARREVERLQRLLRREEPLVTELTVPGRALASALATVRYAVSADPCFPVLGGVLVDRDEDGVRLVATDRYRLALARLHDAPGGKPTGLVMPMSLVDRVLAAEPSGDVVLVAAHGTVCATAAGWGAQADALPGGYPDYRGLLSTPTGPPVPVAEVRAGLGATSRTRVRLGAGGLTSDADGLVVDAAFLWDAVRDVEDGHLVLPGGGVIGPLLVRSADESVLALVMPLREEEPA